MKKKPMYRRKASGPFLRREKGLVMDDRESAQRLVWSEAEHEQTYR